MRSKYLGTGGIADMLRQYDKHLEDYDKYIATIPTFSELSEDLTVIGVLVALPLYQIESDASPAKSLSAAIHISCLFIEWLKYKMQLPPEGLAESMMYSIKGFISDAEYLRWRKLLYNALDLMQDAYLEDSKAVGLAIVYYNKAIAAMLKDYRGKIDEVLENKVIQFTKGESFPFFQQPQYRKETVAKKEQEEGVKDEDKESSIEGKKSEQSCSIGKLEKSSNVESKKNERIVLRNEVSESVRQVEKSSGLGQQNRDRSSSPHGKEYEMKDNNKSGSYGVKAQSILAKNGGKPVTAQKMSSDDKKYNVGSGNKLAGDSSGKGKVWVERVVGGQVQGSIEKLGQGKI